MTPKEVLTLIKDQNIKAIDIRFVDFPGTWQHFTVPAQIFGEDDFTDGLGFDGSSIRGWQAINDSDMLVMPQAETAFVDPFSELPTLVIIGVIKSPITKQNYGRDPRNIATKAEAYLKASGVGDTAYFGPEPEFFMFDDVRFQCESNFSFYEVDSDEGWWNRGRDEGGNNLGHKVRHKQGYFPVAPTDKGQDIRNEMMMTLIDAGLEIECQHHEVATGGQAEIDWKYDTLVQTGDNVLKFKYIVKNVADKYGKTATFMPKPLCGDNGSGMHVHISIWKDGKNTFAGDKYAGMSDAGLYAIGGILKHAPALIAITNPTTNSFKRLVPGFEAPVNLAYSSANRSAVCRIPMYHGGPSAKRVEFRCPDCSSNPYPAFAAIQMAAIDGILNKIDPGEAMDKDLYDLPPEELAQIPSTPGSLGEALDALEADHEFLLAGDVFTKDIIDNWINYKRENEVDVVNQMPHPKEFELYFDV